MNKAACSNKGRNKRKIKDKKNTVSVFKTKGRKAIMYIWHVYMAVWYSWCVTDVCL